MHPYIPHLLSDIATAHRNVQPKEGYPQNVEEELKEVDHWLSGDSEQSFGYFCGLNADQFPPPEQLDNEEVKQVCAAFKVMLHSWNADFDLPENVPPNRGYMLMVNLLNERFTPVHNGVIMFDYCTGYAPDCELKEYCPCLKFWKNKS